MLKLFLVKAGDEINNADYLVWAHDVREAVNLWLDMDAGGLSDIDRVWEFPAAPEVEGVVEWPEPVFRPSIADLDAFLGYEIVTYTHKQSPGVRYRARKGDPLPKWAVDVQDEKGTL